MTFPDPRVTDSGVPEVEQEFDVEVARHQARLEAERRPCNRTDMPGLIGADMPCTDCGHRADQHPAWAAASVPPVTPAEERTGVSDRAAAALTDVAELRRETFRLWSAGTVGRHDGLARLDRIEAALRGEQR